MDALLEALDVGLREHPERLATDDPRDRIAHETFMAVMREYAATADRATGRDVQPSRGAVAVAVGRSEFTVTRATRIASRVVGCLVMIVAGRPLAFDSAERWYAHDHGSRQRGVAPVWAVHVPAWLRPYQAAAVRRRAVLASLGAVQGRPCVCAPGWVAGQPDVTCRAHAGRRARNRRGPGGRSVDGSVDNRTPSDLRRQSVATHPVGGRPGQIHRPGQTPPCGHDQTRKVAPAARLPRRSASTPRQERPGARLTAELCGRLAWAGDIQISRVARWLAPYEREGWDAEAFLTAAAAGWSARYAVSPTVAAARIEAGPARGVRSPGGFLNWLATGLGLTIDAFPDDTATGGRGHELVVPDPVQACGRPECDGLGWLIAEIDGAVAPCRHCPPSKRTTSWADDIDVLDDGAVQVEPDADGNCPF